MNLTSKRMLQFMTVCAGACALTASAQSPYVSDSFEAPEGSLDLPIAQYKQVVTGAQSENTNYVWEATAGDASTLIATDAGNVAYSASSRPLDTDTVYMLNLETEGQTLTRAVTNTPSFATADVYVDTLIKFTPSEDDPEITDPAVKAAVFVNVNSNLVVYSKTAGGAGVVFTNSIIAGTINPTNWYRLTIQMAGDGNLIALPVFQVYLDGQVLTHANAFDTIDTAPTPGGSWFISATTDESLNSVAFQGTGMVDELVVADSVDFGGATAILLTLAYNDTLCDVLTNSASVGNGGTVETGTIIEINCIDWYQVNSVAGTGITYGGTSGDFVQESTGTVEADEAGRTATITVGQYTGTFPMGLDAPYDTINGADLAAWGYSNGATQDAVEADPAAAIDDYLLNVPLGTDAALVITSITVDDTVATVVIEPTDGAVDLTADALNGTLNVYTTDDLAAGFPGTPSATQSIVLETAGAVTVEVDVSAGDFIKAVVE